MHASSLPIMHHYVKSASKMFQLWMLPCLIIMQNPLLVANVALRLHLRVSKLLKQLQNCPMKKARKKSVSYSWRSEERRVGKEGRCGGRGAECRQDIRE